MVLLKRVEMLGKVVKQNIEDNIGFMLILVDMDTEDDSYITSHTSDLDIDSQEIIAEGVLQYLKAKKEADATSSESTDSTR